MWIFAVLHSFWNSGLSSYTWRILIFKDAIFYEIERRIHFCGFYSSKMTGSTKFQPDLLNFRFQKSNFSTHLLRIIYKNLSGTKIGQPEVFPESVPIGTPDPFASMRPPRGVTIQNFRFLGCTVSSWRLAKVGAVKRLNRQILSLYFVYKQFL